LGGLPNEEAPAARRGVMATYQDSDVMKVILDQGELDGDSMEIEDFWEAFHEWICQVRGKFPGISTEQILRCEKLAADIDAIPKTPRN
jgi:hypothetical protein